MVASTHLRSEAKCDDSILPRRAVAALEQLKADVFVYRSYDEFESDSRLARVPLKTFTNKLNQVTAEVEPILSQLSDAKLRSYLSNSLYSYRGGALLWAKLDQKKVFTKANLPLCFPPPTPP